MKKFWKKTEGFTLVELIVVIAILGILAGVGTVGYSGYVKKANMAADQQLIDQVKNAMELYYYGDPESVTGGYVILNQKGTDYTADDYDEVGNKAMTAVFGENWKDSVFLKHADWKGESSTLSYKESSYYGHESELIGTVDNLTTALGKVIEDDAGMSGLIGNKFGDFLVGKKVDTSNGKEVGNAAVLYVARETKDKYENINAAVDAGLRKSYTQGGISLAAVVENIYNELTGTQKFGDAAAMAVVYALTEGFVQYSDQAGSFNPDFSTVSGEDAADDALAALAASFDSLEEDEFAAYVTDGQIDEDMKGYSDMMGTIDNNEEVVSGNLSADDCFTDGTVENLLKGHAAMSNLGIKTEDGQVAVVLVVGGNGNVMSHVTPMNWNK